MPMAAEMAQGQPGKPLQCRHLHQLFCTIVQNLAVHWPWYLRCICAQKQHQALRDLMCYTQLASTVCKPHVCTTVQMSCIGSVSCCVHQQKRCHHVAAASRLAQTDESGTVTSILPASACLHCLRQNSVAEGLLQSFPEHHWLKAMLHPCRRN